MPVYDAGARPIIFLHIPKTAGTTVGEIIRRQYSPAVIFEDEFTRPEAQVHFQNLPRAEKRRYQLFRGHLPYGLHRSLTRPAVYFTFLRHPVDRVLSHYYYVRSRPDLFELHDDVASGRLTLHEIIARDLIADIGNMQTRYLAGLPHLFPADSYTDAHLAAARRNLATDFAVVGLVERFEESLLLLRRAFNWRTVFFTRQNVNRRPQREEIAPETVALIERKEVYDMALYRYAEELFANQLAAYGPSFARELARFRFLNRHVYPALLRLGLALDRIPVLRRVRGIFPAA